MNEILRIFHISDLHWGPPLDAATRSWLAVARQQHHAQGLAGHDRSAKAALRQSIIDAASRDPVWLGKTVLVVTGDLSTWGDQPSIERALTFVKEVANDAVLPSPVVLYGNHDVWPGSPNSLFGLPIAHSSKHLGDHRSLLRKRSEFVARWPRNDSNLFQKAVPLDASLLSLNTVLHARHENTRALGEVRDDYYWQQAGHPPQLKLLHAPLVGSKVAVVLTHHPVHDPNNPQGPSLPIPPEMILKNAQEVAQALGRPIPSSAQPVRLVLSGHTHESWPKPGFLPRTQAAPNTQGYLNGNCVQLTVGTSMQSKDPVTPGTFRQSWQIVQLSALGADELLVERIVLERAHGMGDFVPLSSTTNSANVTEPMTLRL